jgi:glucose-6-phosphate isomerase
LPLDSAFIDLPERLLADYRKQRSTSEVQRILDAARRLAAEVDRVVVLGIGGSSMGARALLESCCDWSRSAKVAGRSKRPSPFA